MNKLALYECANWSTLTGLTAHQLLITVLEDLGLSGEYKGRPRDVMAKLRRTPIHFWAVCGYRDYLVDQYDKWAVENGKVVQPQKRPTTAEIDRAHRQKELLDDIFGL